MAKIKVNIPPERQAEKLLEAVALIIKLRQTNKKWHDVYGYMARKAKLAAEERADKFLESILIKEDE